MIGTIKTYVLTLFFALTFAAIFASTASAACSVTCAAVCRYTCEFEYWGDSCTSEIIEQKARECCTGAFANTPGIDEVPCTESPGGS